MLLSSSAAILATAGYHRGGSTNSSDGAYWRKSAIGGRYSAFKLSGQRRSISIVCRPFAEERVARGATV